MKKMIIILSLLMFSCATSRMGIEITKEQLSFLEMGVTTYDQVITKLGAPTTFSINAASGNKVIMYTYGEARGNLISGFKSKGSSVLLRFDSNGVLVDYTTSSSQGVTN